MSDGIMDSRPRARYRNVRAGDIFRHFKGTLYIVIGIAFDSEDPGTRKLRKVAYMSLDEGQIYHRDIDNFLDVVNREETEFKDKFRFTFVPSQTTILIDERGNFNVNRKF